MLKEKEMRTFKPKGAVYIILTVFLLLFWFIGSSLGIIMIVFFNRKMVCSDNTSFNLIVLAAGCFNLIFFGYVFVYTLWQVIRYKIVVYEDHIYVAANRDLWLVRHKDMNVSYTGIKTLKYVKTLRPDLIDKGMFYFSAIYITRENAETGKKNKEEYILTMWFSRKQALQIMEEIKIMATKVNGYEPEILPEFILKP